MENLVEIMAITFLGVGLMAFFGAYTLGMIGLRAVVNGCVAVFGVSSFAIWARRQNGKTFPPEVRSSPHDGKSDDEKRHAS
jgi:hypothetical protein